MKKTIKAWTVIKKSQNELSEAIFTSKNKAETYFNVAWEAQKIQFPNLPKMHFQRIKSDYKVIPCTITYQIPKKKSK